MWTRIRRWFFRLVVVLVCLPVLLVLLFRWADPPGSSIIIQSHIKALFDPEIRSPQFVWSDWDSISPHMAVAVIASEDQRFPTHFGIDFKELGNVIESGSQRGASTITQQVAKNLFLWQGRSYLRKVLEAGIAVLLEVFWSKQRILEVYLNIAQTGVSTYGVALASEMNFAKPAWKLNRFEAARIAAVLPNPIEYSVSSPNKHVLERQRWILKQMKQLGSTTLLEKIK